MKATPKEYIILRFFARENTYNVRSVPIIDKVTICGVEGFATHRAHFRHDGEPATRLYRCSHIETGATLGEGETAALAIAHAEKNCERKRGTEELLASIDRMRSQLASMTKLA